MKGPPDNLPDAQAWIKETRRRLGWSTTKLADEARAVARREGSKLALTQQTVSGFEQPGVKRIPEWLRFAHIALAEEEARQIERRVSTIVEAPDLPVIHSADAGETVEIIRLDLSLPMGPGATVDDYVEEEPIRFDLAYVRSFTRTPPTRLRLAQGAGDSMFPTLTTNDLVWIDSTQTQVNQQDRIWAVSINGAAAIKRLRRLKGNRVMVVSDNPTHENYEVEEDELRVWGRVIRFARDL